MPNTIAQRHIKEPFKMTASDGAVITAGIAAATANWWEPWVSAIPDVAQGLILTGTVIFVIARAANEVIKFWRSQRERQDSNDRS